MTSIKDDMEEIARLAGLEVIDQKPVIPYDDDPRYEQERRINRYANFSRRLANGNLKENGREVEPVSRDRDELDRNLGSNRPTGAI